MTKEKSLHVFIPGFCGPLHNPADLVHHEQGVAVLRSWLDRLSRGRKRNVSLNYLLNMYRLLGFSLDDFSGVPTAAFQQAYQDTIAQTNTGQMGDDLAGRIMHADPVHLQADMDHAIMTSPAGLDLFDEHADQLVQSLNETFSEDGVRFSRQNANEWFVTASDEIRLQTTPLIDSVGRNVNSLLPTGEAADYWKRLLTEAQMLLHSHEVNDLREARGLPRINSLWFHGNGVLPGKGEHQVQKLFSDDPVILGMACYAGVDAIHCDRTSREAASNCFENIRNALGQGPEGDYIFKVSSLQDLVNYTDVTPWLEQVTVLVENWLEPLLAFCHEQKITFRFYPDNDVIYQLGKYDGLRVWKAAQLYDYIESFGNR